MRVRVMCVRVMRVRQLLRTSLQMDNVVTKENLTTPERNGLMDVTMSVSVRMEQAVATNATTGI